MLDVPFVKMKLIKTVRLVFILMSFMKQLVYYVLIVKTNRDIIVIMNRINVMNVTIIV